MRISDWSSGVCSSDLRDALEDQSSVKVHRSSPLRGTGSGERKGNRQAALAARRCLDRCRERIREREVHADTDADERHGVEQTGDEEHAAGEHASHFRLTSSEEHTSELQPLMRISYAVFCSTKIKNENNKYHKPVLYS